MITLTSFFFWSSLSLSLLSSPHYNYVQDPWDNLLPTGGMERTWEAGCLFSHSQWPENLSHLWSSPKKCLNFASMHCNVGGKEDPRCTNQPMIICSVHKISSEQKEDIFLSTAMAMAVSATPVGVCLHKWEQSFFKLLLIVFYPDLCIKNERWYFNSNVMQMLIVEMNDKAIV